MIVRPATTEDADVIAAIWNHEIRDGVSTFNSHEKSIQEVAALIGARIGAFLVGEINGLVVGFATFSEFRGGVGYAQSGEHTIYLKTVARGQGAGRKLLSALEQSAREAGLHVLVAGIGGENLAGIAFHKAMGFVETGRMPETGRKFGRWMDLVLMQKIL